MICLARQPGNPDTEEQVDVAVQRQFNRQANHKTRRARRPRVSRITPPHLQWIVTISPSGRSVPARGVVFHCVELSAAKLTRRSMSGAPAASFQRISPEPTSPRPRKHFCTAKHVQSFDSRKAQTCTSRCRPRPRSAVAGRQENVYQAPLPPAGGPGVAVPHQYPPGAVPHQYQPGVVQPSYQTYPGGLGSSSSEPATPRLDSTGIFPASVPPTLSGAAARAYASNKPPTRAITTRRRPVPRGLPLQRPAPDAGPGGLVACGL